jgi:predicted dehydrogenase
MDLSDQTHRILQIGHLERFNPAVLALEKVVQQPLFIESHRLAPYKPRGMDTNVVLDLMIHDIDIILHLVDAPVTRIDANGIPVLSEYIDIANARIQFVNGCVANVTASRVSFKAERKMRLFQPDAYITVDFQNRKLAVHRKNQETFDVSATPIVSNQQTFAAADPLQAEIAAFVAAIQNETPPLVTGDEGKRALEMAIEITRQVTANRPTAAAASQSGDGP